MLWASVLSPILTLCPDFEPQKRYVQTLGLTQYVFAVWKHPYLEIMAAYYTDDQ